jgi:hypothetical protein
VAILFLANDPVSHGASSAPGVPCPVPAAVQGLAAYVHDTTATVTSGRAPSFLVRTDLPVVAYQILPFGGGYAAVTGASLLLPTSAWDTNYVGVMAYRAANWANVQTIPAAMAIVANNDDTQVTILPRAAIAESWTIPASPANVPVTYTLKAGEFLQLIQNEELTGSPITSDKPVGVFAAHVGLRVPYDQDYSDHAEQQIPPVRALGSEYAAAGYRDRLDGFVEDHVWRIVGAVDGTMLSFDPPIAGAPTSVDTGRVAEFTAKQPFVVKSQGIDHPFMVFTYMTGSQANAGVNPATGGIGDADFVRLVPGGQYLLKYVFFTDPTYPETNLVVVRKRGKTGFADVNLDCAGALAGWAPIGSGGSYEVTRIDLSRHNFQAQGSCDNGRHEMTSSEPFGLYVWGWGSPETRAGKVNPCDQSQKDNSCDVSYGYPAGENLAPINTVIVPSVIK